MTPEKSSSTPLKLQVNAKPIFRVTPDFPYRGWIRFDQALSRPRQPQPIPIYPVLMAHITMHSGTWVPLADSSPNPTARLDNAGYVSDILKPVKERCKRCVEARVIDGTFKIAIRESPVL